MNEVVRSAERMREQKGLFSFKIKFVTPLVEAIIWQIQEINCYNEKVSTFLYIVTVCVGTDTSSKEYELSSFEN